MAGDDLNIFESNLPQALSRQHKKDTKEDGERQSQQRMGGPGAELEGHPGHVKAQQKSHRLDQAADRGDDAADQERSGQNGSKGKEKDSAQPSLLKEKELLWERDWPR